MTSNRVAGIVLGAGGAERMGQAKQLLPYRGFPLLQHAVDTAIASHLDSVVIVTGAYGDEVEAALQPGRAMTARNRDFQRGNMSSLEHGAAQAPNAAAFVLLMGDHPDLPVDRINQMVELWQADRPWGAVTAYRDRIAHPFLLSRPALDEAIATGGPKLLWHLLAEDSTGRVARIGIDREAPIDINTPADYELLLKTED